MQEIKIHPTIVPGKYFFIHVYLKPVQELYQER